MEIHNESVSHLETGWQQGHGFAFQAKTMEKGNIQNSANIPGFRVLPAIGSQGQGLLYWAKYGRSHGVKCSYVSRPLPSWITGY